MSERRLHWVPGVPVSWPSGGRRHPNVRTFLLAGWPVCPASHDAAGTAVRALVTCKRCLRIMAIARLDTKATIDEVLSRGTEA